MATTAEDYYFEKHAQDSMMTKTLAEFMTQYKSDLETAGWAMSLTMPEFMALYKSTLEDADWAMAKTMAQFVTDMEASTLAAAGWTYTASDVQLAIDESVYTTTSSAFVKKSEITTISDVFTAELRIKVDIKTSIAIRPVYVAIYKNGVLFGAQQSTTSLEYVTKTWDLTPFGTDDTIELWIRTGAGVATISATNFEICGDVDVFLYTGSREWKF